jgi:IS30 family transposase
MTSRLTHKVDSKLRRKWSPEQVSGWLRESEAESISQECIYQYIWKDKKSGGRLYHHLRRQGKCYQSRSKSQAGRGHIRNRVSIDERPAIVDDKTRVGVWEIDLVIGKDHSGALVTIVERATSFTVSERVNSKSVDIVTAATISLLEPYKAVVLTIIAALDAAVYFADPYSSWQRGLNENTNGLLRQYWPKKTDFKNVSQRNVTSVIVALNNRPRKRLNYQTPARKMAEHMAALAA